MGAAVDEFEIQSWHLLEGLGENHEKAQSRQLVPMPRFKPTYLTNASHICYCFWANLLCYRCTKQLLYDFSLPTWYKWGLCSSGMLHSFDW